MEIGVDTSYENKSTRTRPDKSYSTAAKENVVSIEISCMLPHFKPYLTNIHPYAPCPVLFY